MRGGELDRKITLQRKVSTVSDAGSEVETWSALSLRHSASIRPLNGVETFVDPAKVSYEQVEFKIRYSTLVADLSPLDRVIYPALAAANDPIVERNIYDIIGVQEIGRKEGFKVLARRRSDATT